MKNGFLILKDERLKELMKMKSINNYAKIWIYILRNTVGFNRKSHQMTSSFLSDGTGINERQVNKIITQLKKEGYIIVKLENKKKIITLLTLSNLTLSNLTPCRISDVDPVESVSNHPVKSDTQELSIKKERIRSKDVLAIPYGKIKKMFNEICVDFSKILEITSDRKPHINARHKKLKDIKGWEKFFHVIQDSDYLTGRNGAWKNCDFDWIIKGKNFVKIMEGKYDEKKKVNYNGKDYDLRNKAKTCFKRNPGCYGKKGEGQCGHCQATKA